MLGKGEYTNSSLLLKGGGMRGLGGIESAHAILKQPLSIMAISAIKRDILMLLKSKVGLSDLLIKTF